MNNRLHKYIFEEGIIKIINEYSNPGIIEIMDLLYNKSGYDLYDDKFAYINKFNPDNTYVYIQTKNITINLIITCEKGCKKLIQYHITKKDKFERYQNIVWMHEISKYVDAVLNKYNINVNKYFITLDIRVKINNSNKIYISDSTCFWWNDFIHRKTISIQLQNIFPHEIRNNVTYYFKYDDDSWWLCINIKN
jgi:hypothetical protein